MKADPTVKQTLEDAKIDLLLNFPFYGLLASKMPLVEVKSIPTLATNYKRIFYNPDFVKSLTHDNRVAAFVHELKHCVHGHFLRREGRDADYWNMAGDYEINYDIVNEEYIKGDGTRIKGIGSIQPSWLYDERFAEMSAEEIYKIIEDEKWPKKSTMDQHMDPEEGDDKDNKQEEDDGETLGEEIDALPKLPSMSSDEIERAEQEFFQSVMNAEATCDAGQIPGKIKRMIKTLKEPRKNWRELIRSSIESAFKPHRSWINPHRRSWTQGWIMPGPVPEKAINVAVAIDMSGSISIQQGTDLLSEVAGIMQQFKQYTVTVWTFDHIVYSKTQMVFNETNGNRIEDFTIKGGGGTNFGINWNHMKKNEIKPDRFLMFTDGLCGFADCDPDYVDTIWLIHGQKDWEAPFGLVTYFEENNEHN